MIPLGPATVSPLSQPWPPLPIWGFSGMSRVPSVSAQRIGCCLTVRAVLLAA